MAKLSRCGEKVCYPNQYAVIKRILIVSRKRGGSYRPYFHSACKSWHMTSMREYTPQLDTLRKVQQ